MSARFAGSMRRGNSFAALAIVLCCATPTVAADFWSRPNVFGGYTYSSGSFSMPNSLGGYNHSSGLSNSPNVFGGFNYSNGLTSTPNVFGGMNYSNGFYTVPNSLGGQNFYGSSGQFGSSSPNPLGGFFYWLLR